MALTPIKAAWNCDESSGNAADATGNGFTLTNNNIVAFGTGRINNGMAFGATNTNGNFSNTNNMGLAVDDARSYSIWVNIATAPASGTVMDFFGQGYAVNDVFYQIEYLNNAGTKMLRVGRGRNGVDDPTLTFNTDLGTGTWHHIVYTNDGSFNQQIYLDNSLSASNTAISGNGSGGGTFDGTVVSRALFAVARVTQGSQDILAVFPQKITASDVSTLWNAGAGIQYSFSSSVNKLTLLGVS